MFKEWYDQYTSVYYLYFILILEREFRSLFL